MVELYLLIEMIVIKLVQHSAPARPVIFIHLIGPMEQFMGRMTVKMMNLVDGEGMAA